MGLLDAMLPMKLLSRAVMQENYYRFDDPGDGSTQPWFGWAMNQLPEVTMVLLLVCLPLATLGQGTFVIPPGFEKVEGDAFFDVGGSPQHFQVLAEPGAFPALAPGGVLLTAVSFRADTREIGFDGGQRSFKDLQIILSSEGITGGPRFFYEPGPDQTFVYSSSIAWDIPRPSTRPADFAIRIPFERPFLYRPGAQILLDFNIADNGAGWIGDWTSSSVMTTLARDGTGNVFPFRMRPVLQFEFQAVPEPGPLVLLALGILLIAQRRARCH